MLLRFKFSVGKAIPDKLFDFFYGRGHRLGLLCQRRL
jgi:hypothetical protein